MFGIKVAAALVAAVGLAVTATVATAAPRQISVRPRSTGGTHVHGTVLLSAAGKGTHVELDVLGLPPKAKARSLLHAGTDPQHLSAST